MPGCSGLSFRFFDLHGSSSIFNRVTGDVQNTRLFVDGVVLQGINMVLTLGAYFVFMWRIHPGLTMACLSRDRSALVGDALLFRNASARPISATANYSISWCCFLLKACEECRRLKALPPNRSKSGDSKQPTTEVSAQQKRIFFDLSVFTPVTQILSQISLVILFAYGGWLYVQGRIALGSGLVVFAGLMQQFNGQVANITTIANSVQQSFTAARRVFEVLDTKSEVENKPQAIKATKLKGTIVFETSPSAIEHRRCRAKVDRG